MKKKKKIKYKIRVKKQRFIIYSETLRHLIDMRAYSLGLILLEFSE